MHVRGALAKKQRNAMRSLRRRWLHAQGRLANLVMHTLRAAEVRPYVRTVTSRAQPRKKQVNAR
eukprot:3944567-Pyramimonas_sp.AAC.2